MVLYKPAGTGLQELFRQYILGKQHVKFNLCVCFVLFLHSTVLAFGVLEFLCHGQRQFFGS